MFFFLIQGDKGNNGPAGNDGADGETGERCDGSFPVEGNKVGFN